MAESGFAGGLSLQRGEKLQLLVQELRQQCPPVSSKGEGEGAEQSGGLGAGQLGWSSFPWQQIPDVCAERLQLPSATQLGFVCSTRQTSQAVMLSASFPVLALTPLSHSGAAFLGAPSLRRGSWVLSSRLFRCTDMVQGGSSPSSPQGCCSPLLRLRWVLVSLPLLSQVGSSCSQSLQAQLTGWLC